REGLDASVVRLHIGPEAGDGAVVVALGVQALALARGEAGVAVALSGAVEGLALFVLAGGADDVGELRRIVAAVGQRADEVDQRVAQRDAGVELGGVAL